MEYKNVFASSAKTAAGHYDVFARTIFEDDRVSVRHNLILASGGAEEHAHEFDAHHIFFVLRGALRVRCGGAEHVFRAGTAFWFAPGEKHQVCADGVADAEYLTVNAPSFGSFKGVSG